MACPVVICAPHLFCRDGVRRTPDGRRIQRRLEIISDLPVDPRLMRRKIVKEEIPADPRDDAWNISLEARHVSDRQAEADERRGVEDVDVAKIRRAAGLLLQKFVAEAKIRMRTQD